jgi:YggT family protein
MKARTGFPGLRSLAHFPWPASPASFVILSALTDPCLQGVAMYALFWLIDQLIGLYVWALIIAAVFSLLVSFNVLDTRNRFVWTVGDFLYKITEPAIRPIRRFMPNLGGIDISPMILILVLYAVRIFLWQTLWPLVGG